MRPTLPKIDAELLGRAQRGDGEAHAALYASFSGMVFTLARRMLASAALAEDVLQDTFVEVIRKSGSYRGDAAIGFWIRRIAVNKCLSHLRSAWVAQRASTADAEASLMGRTEDRADRTLELERALDALPALARAVVLMHDVEGYTHQEIGQLMGRSASFSKSQLARAHEKLRALLVGEENDGRAPRTGRPERERPCLTALKTC
jgi:RNA polymerase sigma-70 factor, ECF subfamily